VEAVDFQDYEDLRDEVDSVAVTDEAAVVVDSEVLPEAVHVGLDEVVTDANHLPQRKIWTLNWKH